MSLFCSTFSPKPIPKGCEGLEIRIQSSTCTGEKTIGFYDRVQGRLLYSELVRGDADIEAFYRKYGIKRNK
ncbi:MAG: hypothetical protein IJM75_02555 [Ruminococcus sp.]|nr:hypothetical protein [Ruminococcus sp.]